MKLRDILKVVSFVLLISGILICLKHPLLYAIGSLGLVDSFIGTSVIAYYTDVASIFDVIVYIAFAVYMNQLDSKFPKAHFGRFFRIDIVVTLINTVVLNLTYDNLMLGYIPKIILEAVASLTTFLCGYAIFQTLRNNAMRKIRLSYWMLSLRHVIYFFVLCTQLYCLTSCDGYTADQFGTTTWVVWQWVLLMPILLLCRILLFKGTMELKKHKHHHKTPVV